MKGVRIMKRFVTLAVLSLALVATTASAALRSPQVPVFGGGLQGYLNSVGESINVATDQNAAQRWVSTVSTNSVFTIQVELGANAANNTLGLYNASSVSPSLYQVFPGAATAGWFAVASFRSSPTRVVVNLFDDNAASQGSTVYLGADRNDFGFYISGPNGTWYTQDSRNAGAAQALTFAGTGINSGQWWLCFEDTTLDGTTQDYADAVLFLESVNPTPVSKSSWGELKRRFR
jgi:hypothetical protein